MTTAPNTPAVPETANAGRTPRPQRRGLGRGLGSLIPTHHEPDAALESPPHDAPRGRHALTRPPSVPSQPGDTTGTGGAAATPAGVALGHRDLGAADSATRFAELPIGQITPNRRQPREIFDEEAMTELVASIEQVGVLQPVVVRPLVRRLPDGAAPSVGYTGTPEPRYELIMGERRWRAAQQAGLSSVPAIVRETDDDAMLRDALLENLHRSQLNPLEEAAAYEQLLTDFGCTHEELAGRIGRSRPQISNTIRLLNLGPAGQRRVAAGVLSAGHARALLAVADPKRQDQLADRVVAEGISVRGLEEIVALGDTEAVQPRVRAPRPVAPGLAEIGERLADRLETRVKVTLGKSKGRISVEFASLSDLQRIVGVIDPRNRMDRPI